MPSSLVMLLSLSLLTSFSNASYILLDDIVVQILPRSLCGGRSASAEPRPGPRTVPARVEPSRSVARLAN